MCEYLDLAASVVGAIATCFAAYVGYKALQSWKKIKKASLAEEIIILAHELQGVIEWSRFPGQYKEDGQTRERDPNENKSEAKCKDQYFSCVERLQKEQHVISQIPVLKIKADLYFSEFYISTKLSGFVDVMDDIKNSSISLIEGSQNKGKHRSVIWSSGKDDIINKKVSDFVRGIESALQKFCK
jgi:hypothetical protein